MSVLVLGAFLAFLLTALLCWLWALGVDMVQAAEVTGFCERAAGSSRSYWKPEAVRINKS
jgi:hypothetical protein